MSNLATIKKKGPKHQRRLRVAESFILACVSLPENTKAHVEQSLALSAYGDGSLDPYTPGSKRNGVESAHHLCECLCYCEAQAAQEAWAQWANMVKKANLWEFERIEAVREMLGVLIGQKNKYSLTGTELLEAAEKALEWTRWDESNCAKARLRNSPEFKGWQNALASRVNVEEADKQFLAFARKSLAQV
jgi:hypothetical protein